MCIHLRYLTIPSDLNRSKMLRNLPFTAELISYSTSDGNVITPLELVRDLGVLVSSNCSWTSHINNMVKEASKIASWVLSVFQDRSQFLMVTLLKSLVRSKLEYCCPLWNPTKISDNDIISIENVQRQFTRRISSCKDLNYWDRLKKLQIMSLQRRERYIIVHTLKILMSEAPNDIEMEFHNTERLGLKAKVPTLNQKAQRWASSAYDNTFGVKASRLWNILPKHTNQKTTLESFKVALGKFLDQFPDTPPSPGYTPVNSNSLLDKCCQGGYIGGRA